ncbi:MAG: transposase [Opitutaceae bacterium]
MLIDEVGLSQAMPRSLRVEYAGALYHVINRGNYRRDVFETDGAAEAFVTVLTETAQRYGWKVYAYVVMRNHYHLAVETPQPNLSDGMHWLQSTLAIRFNRLRAERGHLFQGRYQALLIENREILSHVVAYIHLNPVRAHCVAADQVASFRWSSLAGFVQGRRFKGLEADYWLGQHGWKDGPSDWKSYTDHLRGLAEDEAEQKRLGFEAMCKGWLLGTAGWKKATAKDQTHLKLTVGIDRVQARELKEARWELRLNQLLQEHGARPVDEGRKNQKWKLDIALQLRDQEGASATWLAQALHLGTPATARNYLSLHRR